MAHFKKRLFETLQRKYFGPSWGDELRNFYDSGDLFVPQSHPKRVLCKSIIEINFTFKSDAAVSDAILNVT